MTERLTTEKCSRCRCRAPTGTKPRLEETVRRGICGRSPSLGTGDVAGNGREWQGARASRSSGRICASSTEMRGNRRYELRVFVEMRGIRHGELRAFSGNARKLVLASCAPSWKCGKSTRRVARLRRNARNPTRRLARLRGNARKSTRRVARLRQNTRKIDAVSCASSQKCERIGVSCETEGEAQTEAQPGAAVPPRRAHWPGQNFADSPTGFRHSFVIRASSFVIWPARCINGR